MPQTQRVHPGNAAFYREGPWPPRTGKQDSAGPRASRHNRSSGLVGESLSVKGPVVTQLRDLGQPLPGGGLGVAGTWPLGHHRAAAKHPG